MCPTIANMNRKSPSVQNSCGCHAEKIMCSKQTIRDFPVGPGQKGLNAPRLPAVDLALFCLLRARITNMTKGLVVLAFFICTLRQRPFWAVSPAISALYPTLGLYVCVLLNKSSPRRSMTSHKTRRSLSLALSRHFWPRALNSQAHKSCGRRVEAAAVAVALTFLLNRISPRLN